MRELIEMFREGGWWMYPILLLGGLGLVASLGLGVGGLFVRRARATAIMAVGLLAVGLVVVTLGWLGMRSGMSTVRAAVAHVAPDQQAQILAEGLAESRTCLIFALALGVWPLVVGAGQVVLAFARQSVPAPVIRRLAALPAALGVLGGGLLVCWSEVTLRVGEQLVARGGVDEGDSLVRLAGAQAHAHAMLGAGLFVVGAAIALALLFGTAGGNRTDLAAGPP